MLNNSKSISCAAANITKAFLVKKCSETSKKGNLVNKIGEKTGPTSEKETSLKTRVKSVNPFASCQAICLQKFQFQFQISHELIKKG